MKHYSVLKNEIIDSLNIKSNGIYIDATLGYGGMSKEILKRLDTGLLIAFDQDQEAIDYSEQLLKKVSDNLSLDDYYKNIDMKEVMELTSGLELLRGEL